MSASTCPPPDGSGRSARPAGGRRTHPERAGHSGREDGPDGLERALLQARELIDSTMSRHRADQGPLVLADDTDAGATVAQMLGRAKHSVAAALPGDGEQSRAVFAALDGLRAESDAAGPAQRSGPIVRLLCTPRALSAEVPSPDELRVARCEIRVVDGELRETLIVDGRIALIQAGPEPSASASLVRDLASVRALDLLFAGSWANARPLEEHLRLSESLRTPSAQRVLEQLCEGQTDELAAQKLQVSLRTYRRHVAAVMRDLGVNSRFQAGVRAVELGLLPRRVTAGREEKTA